MTSRQRGNGPGQIARNVAENVGLFRRRARLTQEELSAHLADVRPIPTASIAKIEAGIRRVDVDDLWALARALTISPTTLMEPAHKRLQDPGEVRDA